MVIERFKDGGAERVGERFRRSGRMMPEDVQYHVSWVDQEGSRCFQVMEAPHAESLRAWISCWDDLVDFEVVPVLRSHEFWAKTLR